MGNSGAPAEIAFLCHAVVLVSRWTSQATSGWRLRVCHGGCARRLGARVTAIRSRRSTTVMWSVWHAWRAWHAWDACVTLAARFARHALPQGNLLRIGNSVPLAAVSSEPPELLLLHAGLLVCRCQIQSTRRFTGPILRWLNHRSPPLTNVEVRLQELASPDLRKSIGEDAVPGNRSASRLGYGASRF
jgi:hypothetical protein